MAGWGREEGRGDVPAAAVTQRRQGALPGLTECMSEGMWLCPFPQMSTPSTAHKHGTRTAHRWPGYTCRLVPMGHRAFLLAGTVVL
eukprot:722221-Prymnesium_polylepis.1